MKHATARSLRIWGWPLAQPAFRAMLLGFTIVTVSVSLPFVSIAQEEDEIIILEEVLCKELMGQAGNDRDRSISFLHGFVLGGADRGKISVNNIIDVESVFFDTCLDNPTERALTAMKAAHGIGQ